MFYETIDNKHGLRHDPFKALIVPRPIGWISTISPEGVVNLAPYSFFNAMGDKPFYVIFSSTGHKDSVTNIIQTGEFVCSMATWDLRNNMNTTSAMVPRGVDEFPLAGLTAAKSTMVKPPRVKESPAAFECRHFQTIELPPEKDGQRGHTLTIGKVVGIYIDDTFVNDGMVDTAAMKPIARLGYMDYAVVTPETTFTIHRPQVDEAGRIVDPKAAE